MEMCYDGTLVMPSNYAVMDEEEMTYVEGGWCIEHHWWGKYLYLTHSECKTLETGYLAGSLASAIFTLGAASAILGGILSLIGIWDDGYGIKLRYTGFGTKYAVTGIWSLSKSKEDKMAKKNNHIYVCE